MRWGSWVRRNTLSRTGKHKSGGRAARGTPPAPGPMRDRSADVTIDQLRHLEHRDLPLAAEDRAQAIVGVDHAPLLLILEPIALDVLPQLLRDLGAWHRAIAHYGGESIVGLHGPHECRIRCTLATARLPPRALPATGRLLPRRALPTRALPRAFSRAFLLCGHRFSPERLRDPFSPSTTDSVAPQSKEACCGCKGEESHFRSALHSGFRQPPQQLHHLHVPGIGRRIVVADVHVLLRRLEDERHCRRAPVIHQPAERLLSHRAFPYENVPVEVRTEITGTVVQVEEGGRLTAFLLEFVQHRLQRPLRNTDVVARHEQVTGVEPVPSALTQRVRHMAKNGSHLGGGATDLLSCPRGILDEETCRPT